MNGIINVYKEKGYTSHDVVAKLRGIFKQKKIGHTGTLDPDAEGVLPVCLGSATKLCDMITAKEKAYQTVLLLGVTTDTQDISGTVLKSNEVNLSEEDVKSVVSQFVGDIMQIPPMYSAIKVNGKKLYELAREGKEIEREPRPVTIHKIIISKIELPRVWMEVHCSKGTYIRTLCNDIGDKLGVGGTMENLLRIKSGNFDLTTAYKLGEIDTLVKSNEIESKILSVESVFEDYPSFSVKEEFQKFVLNGNRLSLNMTDMKNKPENGSQFKCFDYTGKFIGIFEYKEKDNDFKPVKLFLN